MLDRSQLREDTQRIRALLEARGYQLDTKHFLTLDKNQKSCLRALQDLQTERRARAKEFEALVKQGKSPDEARAQLGLNQKGADSHTQKLESAREALKKADTQLHNMMLEIPNIPDPTVHAGNDETDNKPLNTSDIPIPTFDFEPKDHTALAGTSLDTQLAAQLTGARFMVLRGNLARLHRALGQFMLDYHTNDGYEEVYVPYIASSASLHGTGQLPKFEEDLFALADNDWYLIPTAEVPLTNLYADQILEHKELEKPVKLVAHTPCFRREAGSYGRDTQGVLRQHQFDKVELVHICQPSQAEDTFKVLNKQVASILTELDLPYRTVALCTGDLGFAATCTIDYEVWLPSQNKYREISSCSHFGDFQARRMNLRWRTAEDNKIMYAHTLNASGVAVGRCMAALLENNQQADGTVRVPKALVRYMDGARTMKLNH